MTLEQRQWEDVSMEVAMTSTVLGGGCEFYWTGLMYIVVEPDSGVATVVDAWGLKTYNDYVEELQ